MNFLSNIVYLSIGASILIGEAGIIKQAHNGGERQRALVDGLQEVGEDHDGQDPLVNLLLEQRITFRTELSPVIMGVLSNFLIDLVRDMLCLLLVVDGVSLSITLERVLAAQLACRSDSLGIANID